MHARIFFFTEFPQQHQDKDCVVDECDGEDLQRDLFYCKFREPRDVVMSDLVEYEEIFLNDVKKQMIVMQILFQKYNNMLNYIASLTERETQGDQEEE